jgi:hypothetical protein
MSTPGAIAVYCEAGHQPQVVTDRSWRGVYHHGYGDLDGLGKLLIERVQKSGGDMPRAVRELIDEAPFGWSDISENERYDSEDPGLPVSFGDTSSVAFVYTFDLEGRRIDAFATYADAGGERIGSVSFASDGTPTPAAFDLDALELVVEAPLKGGEPLSAAGLQVMLKELPKIENDGHTIEWRGSSVAPNGALLSVFWVILWEDGAMRDIVEREVELVPVSVRSEPARVRNFLTAFADVATKHLTMTVAYDLLSKNPLARTQVRSEETFRSVLLSPSYFG